MWLHPWIQDFWKRTVVKSQTNATSVTLHSLDQAISGNKWVSFRYLEPPQLMVTFQGVFELFTTMKLGQMMKSKTNQYEGLKGVIYRHYCCAGFLFYGWETLTKNVFRSLACIQLKLHCIQLKCFFPECVSMWFFRLKACVAVFYIVCTCTVNSCRTSLQYDGQASLNYQSNKCNQCNYAWSDPSAFRPHLITHNGEKSKNVNNVTLHLIACSVWGIIWKHTVEKNQTNATSVISHPSSQIIWRSIS